MNPMEHTGEDQPRRQRSAFHVISTIGALAAPWASSGLARRQWPSRGAAGPASAEEVISGLLAWSVVALTTWLAVIASLTVMAAAPGAIGRCSTHVASRLTPAAARRALSLALGASVGTVALPAPMAMATTITQESGSSPDSQVPTPGFHVTLPPPAQTEASRLVSPVRDGLQSQPSRSAATAPGWLPDRPTPRAKGQDTRLLSPALRAQASVVDSVTVRRGETLWSIAARHLGPEATDAQVAAEWPRWYAANRRVIGDDPALIHPGQQLVAPIAEVAR